MENENPQCPHCKCQTVVVKNGVIKETQRYLCKKCKTSFKEETPHTAYKADKQRQALILYLEGVYISEIGKLLGVNRNTVRKWVSKCTFDNIKHLQNKRLIKYHGIETVSLHNDSMDNLSFNSGFVILEGEEKTYILFKKKSEFTILPDTTLEQEQKFRNIE